MIETFGLLSLIGIIFAAFMLSISIIDWRWKKVKYREILKVMDGYDEKNL